MIEADALTKRYGSFSALEDLTLRVGRGEVFGFLGPNGAGKSTTTKLLCTLLRPTEGTARVAGFDVVKESPEVRRRIGYLPEKVPVYKPLTAREDLRHFGRLHGMPEARLAERIDEVLERVGLTDVDHRRAGTFSKGMTQRLGIARAILHEPDVLFFDEPASGLDPTGRRMIRQIMLDLTARGATVFLCSHDLAEVRAVAKRIGFIRHDRLVNVRGVGEAAEGRLLELEVEGATDKVLDAIRNVEGVLVVEAEPRGEARTNRGSSGEEGDAVKVRGAPTLDRREVARAVRRGGGTLLAIEQKEESLEALYAKYVEDGPTDARTESASGKEVTA